MLTDPWNSRNGEHRIPLRSFKPLFNEISKMSDICSSFRKIYTQGLYTYFETAQLCFSLVSEKKRVETPKFYD